MDERFEIRGELGRGGMATVYLALDRSRDELVALKVLHRHLVDRPSARGRLERELRAARRVAHHAILHPVEAVQHDGVPALVLPALSGQTLSDRIAAGGTLGEDELQRLLDEIGGALAAGHAVGVLHRDVTPNNVLWDAGQPRLADFGLARLADQGTATTGALGTVGYAAPETYAEGASDPRCDAYSLGAVLFFAATGRPPFDAPTGLGALQQQLEGQHTPLASLRPDLPRALIETIEALLVPEQDQRPSVPEALQRLPRRPRAPTAPRRLLWTQVGSGLSLLALVGLGWFQDIGSFLIATIVQGHGLPQPDIHEMTQGISALVLLPLALLPGVIGAVAGRGEPERRVAPWVGIGALAILDLVYAMLAGVVLPAWGMRGTADLFGTMLYHQGLFVVLAALIVGLVRPWRSLRLEVPAPAPAPVPLADEARRALGQLAAALEQAPQAVAVDLRGLVRQLRGSVDALASELTTVEAALEGLVADPGELAELEARRARAEAHGAPSDAIERALEAARALAAEADALEARRVCAIASLLEVRAEAARARRALLDTEAPEAITAPLRQLGQRARLAQQAARELSG